MRGNEYHFNDISKVDRVLHVDFFNGKSVCICGIDRAMDHVFVLYLSRIMIVEYPRRV